MSTHDLKRTQGPARLAGPRQITYACLGCDFTVTDNGREAKAAWLRHLLDTRADEVRA